jgi:hypothetical protein
MTLKFGGHETFVIREGWLHKGLQLQINEPELLATDDAADGFGVGRNMAKSIRHWLLATGLAERANGNRGPMIPSRMGELVWREDPYFLAPGTWWALHIELATQPGRAGAWYWFFNHFGSPRFERPTCLQSLVNYLQMHRRRLPSRRTLERDVACLLRCYARSDGNRDADPEDGNDCGLAELRLLRHSATTGLYERDSGPKPVPASAIGYNIARVWPEAAGGEGSIDIGIDRLAREPGGPGRILQMTADALFETLQQAERSSRDIEITGLGAERALRISQRAPLAWLREYYAEEAGKQAHAA